MIPKPLPDRRLRRLRIGKLVLDGAETATCRRLEPIQKRTLGEEVAQVGGEARHDLSMIPKYNALRRASLHGIAPSEFPHRKSSNAVGTRTPRPTSATPTQPCDWLRPRRNAGGCHCIAWPRTDTAQGIDAPASIERPVYNFIHNHRGSTNKTIVIEIVEQKGIWQKSIVLCRRTLQHSIYRVTHIN